MKVVTLPYAVYLWSEDETRVEQCLATAALPTIASMAMDAACLCYPDRYITLTGPGADERRRPPPSPKAMVPSGAGWTNDPTRYEFWAQR